MADNLTLNVLVPTEIADSILISSTAPENDYAAWNSGTTYALGDRVISATTHKIYESGANSNLNKDPTVTANRTGAPPWWIEVQPTNRHAMFDGMVSTATTVATPLTVVLRPGFINAMYFAGFVAEQCAVTIKDAPLGNVVFSATCDLEDSQPPDYWEHFFLPFRQQYDLLLTDLPPYSDMEITITISATSGNVSCGLLTIGDLRPLGMTEWGAEAQPKTYSYISEDTFGNAKIIQRPASKNMSLTAAVEIENADFVEETVRILQDTPAVWIGLDADNYAALRVFGLGSGTLRYGNAKEPILSLTVKGGPV